ncbi:unnamed protein product [Trifolium pratense]|uniref:Uncharacterized protein n=1 Tax=Trifolium pratense TaxID=57577 RepID=A0ACB0JS60_TRIPR|nr:unnamed protein product [Trifolium pratense]
MLSHEANSLKVIFIPFIATSHIIPMVDMARLFAIHGGVDITIITTAGNIGIFQNSINRDFSNHGRSIKTHILEFPAEKVGLPVGIETFNADIPPYMASKVLEGFEMLQPQIENYLFGETLEVDCIVSDSFYPWTVEVASKLGIPRIVFCPTSIFSRCVELSFEQDQTHTKVDSDYDKFTIFGLPHKLEITRLQLPDWIKETNRFGERMKVINDTTSRSYGAVFNSFYDLEGAYEEHYKNVFGTKCWSLGPVSLWANQDVSYKAERGHKKVVQEDGLFKWLNSKKENSVIYVSFGSMNKFPLPQLIEIAHALEASSHDFIWVVRTKNTNDKELEQGFMEEFEKRVKESNKGYLIWGWAPQLLILENKAIGAIVTHLGWNTTIESINVGLPMVTWPLFSEQFFHEKLVVDVLRIGVSVGVREWRNWNQFTSEDLVKREDIGKAIGLVMENGKEAEEMRLRAKGLSDDAKKAILVGGSSYANLRQLIEEVRALKLQRLNGN